MPVESSERLAGLDVLRGFALYGVLLTNAMVSSRPLGEALGPPSSIEIAANTSLQWYAWAAFDGLLVTKFVAIFSLLFGMGLVLQNQRAEAKGLPFAKIYSRRLAILAGMGVVHGCFLFEGDILLVYAVVGAILFQFRHQSARVLFGISLIPLTLGLILALIWSSLDIFNPASQSAIANSLLESNLHQAAFLESLTIRPLEYLGWLVISSLMSFNCRVVAFFFMGAACMKSGWIRPSCIALQRNVGLIGLTLGLALEGLSVHFTSSASAPSLGIRVAKTFCDEFGSLVLSFGYVGIVLWTVHSSRLRVLADALAAVGRTALTNYVLQSVFLNIAFMAYALGLYQELSRVEVLGWFSLIFVAQMFASTIWLHRFRMGPLEQLWRSLTYRGLP